jgi:hypothetical protein
VCVGHTRHREVRYHEILIPPSPHPISSSLTEGVGRTTTAIIAIAIAIIAIAE